MLLYTLMNGEWVAGENRPKNPDRANFKIVCDYGDWSGYRTLADCLAQIPNWKNRRPGFYRIVED